MLESICVLWPENNSLTLGRQEQSFLALFLATCASRLWCCICSTPLKSLTFLLLDVVVFCSRLLRRLEKLKGRVLQLYRKKVLYGSDIFE